MQQPAIKEQSPAPIKQYYRRSLPETCISFCSEEGQKIFKEAITTGHMNCYFSLAAQFRTQDEPAFCGLSTLVMVLNALEVDPGKLWKGCWRWYHEDMLDCCEPLDDVKKHGISFDQFVCLAFCNYLNVDSTRGDESMTEESFRDSIKSATEQERSYIVVSYSRSTLEQTGDGHFSPIGGYHPEKDLVLILDVARFKYPPYWVSLKLLVEAMRKIDKSTGLPRGYMLVSRQKERLPLLIFRISSAFAVTQNDKVREHLMSCITQWNEWLSESGVDAVDIMMNEEEKFLILGEAINQILQLLRMFPENCNLLTTQIDMTCGGASCDHVCAVCQLLADIESTELYKLISNNTNIEYFHEDLSKIGVLSRWPKLANQMDCLQFSDLNSAHFLTILLLAWPYCKQKNTHGSKLESCANFVLQNSSHLVRNEVYNLRKQIATIFNLNNCCCKKNL